MKDPQEDCPRDPFSLAGECALITGGGTGLGLGMARCFVRAGAKVILVGRREGELKAASKQLGSAAGFIPYDITRVDRAGELVSRAAGLFQQPISILINNAGNHLKKPAVETTPAEFAALLNTHVIAAHALSAAVLPGMIQRGHGSILFIASMTSFFGVPNVIAYAAAKSACLGMVRSLATEVSAAGVRVNALAPGWIDTEMLRSALDADPERKRKIISRTPMATFGSPEDIGLAAVYLCSPAARFVTGAVLPVDGGASIGF